MYCNIVYESKKKRENNCRKETGPQDHRTTGIQTPLTIAQTRPRMHAPSAKVTTKVPDCYINNQTNIAVREFWTINFGPQHVFVRLRTWDKMFAVVFSTTCMPCCTEWYASSYHLVIIALICI